MTDLEYDYLREKAYIHAEKEILERELLKEELELKPAKIEIKYDDIIRKVGRTD